MSKAKLREKLDTLPKENVINLMMSLYDASKEAKTYLEFYLTPDSYAEVEKYKKIIQNEFSLCVAFLKSHRSLHAARLSLNLKS